MRAFIRMLYEHSTGDSDKCIKACAKAKQENGMWTCPLFKFGVEKVSVVNEHGAMCRMFERRES